MSIASELRSLINKTNGHLTTPVTQARVPDDHVDSGTSFLPIISGEDYFTVRLNEMFLSSGKNWFVKYLPMAWTLTEFNYNGSVQAVPFVVGSGMAQLASQQLPEGMLFRDIRVAGVHPYCGGKVSLTFILYRVPLSNGADTVLDVAEAAATALDFATMLAPYLKVAGAVVRGVTALLNLDTTPLVGCRHDIDPDSGDEFRPGFYALIAGDIAPSDLWVRERQLFVGPDSSKAQPLRDADYVLYSINRPSSPGRSDVETLPFFKPLWQRVERFANLPDRESYKTAKVNMSTLGLELYQSPDLTRHHAEKLYLEYATRMRDDHELAKAIAEMGTAKELSEDERVMRNIVSQVLDQE